MKTSYNYLPITQEDLDDFAQYFSDISLPRGKKSISFSYRANPKSFATRIYRAFKCDDGFYRLRLLKNSPNISSLIGYSHSSPMLNTEGFVLSAMSSQLVGSQNPALVLRRGEWVAFANAKEIYEYLKASRISKLRAK